MRNDLILDEDRYLTALFFVLFICFPLTYSIYGQGLNATLSAFVVGVEASVTAVTDAAGLTGKATGDGQGIKILFTTGKQSITSHYCQLELKVSVGKVTSAFLF